MIRTIAWLLIGLLLQVALNSLWQACAAGHLMGASEAVRANEERGVLPDEGLSIARLQATPCPQHSVEAQPDPVYLHTTSSDLDRRIVASSAGIARLDVPVPLAERSKQAAIPRSPPDLSQVITSLRSVKLRI